MLLPDPTTANPEKGVPKASREREKIIKPPKINCICITMFKRALCKSWCCSLHYTRVASLTHPLRLAVMVQTMCGLQCESSGNWISGYLVPPPARAFPNCHGGAAPWVEEAALAVRCARGPREGSALSKAEGSCDPFLPAQWPSQVKPNGGEGARKGTGGEVGVRWGGEYRPRGFKRRR